MACIDAATLSDIVTRRNAGLTDLAPLCRDIPLTARYTSESHTPNDFYGHAEQIKRFLHLPSQYPLKAAIQHGNQYAGRYWDVEAGTALPVRLAWGTHIRDAWATHSEKKTYMISTPFCYTQGILSEEETAAERKRLGRNLLLFPAHSNHSTTITFDVSTFLNAAKTLMKDFESVRICIYWKDYILGLHK
ncbi:MAG: hypothetical protein LBH94_02275, partial [Deltaproteobacteria bacterium]|nr:hypothetical protein [Deltaproteobacteria bacterium]